MKSDETYRFSLSWPTETEEQILAGEFLGKLGNKKSRFIVELICNYLREHPEVMNKKETIQFVIKSTSVGSNLTEIIRSMIQDELAGKTFIQDTPVNSEAELKGLGDDNIDVMFDNLEVWK